MEWKYLVYFRSTLILRIIKLVTAKQWFAENGIKEKYAGSSNDVAVICTGNITLEVSNDISEILLRVLLQEVTHA